MLKFKKWLKFAKSSPQRAAIAVQIVIGMSLCLVFLVIFIHLTTQMVAQDFDLLDLQFSESVYSLRTPVLTAIMLVVTKFGAGVTLVVAVLLCIILLMKQHRKESLLLASALLIRVLLNSSCKLLIQRPRPDIAPLVHESSYSFPSAHAMNAFVFYALLAYFSYHFFRSKRVTVLLSFGAMGVILLVGFSRIYLGVHYLTDVIAGYIVGFWWFVTILSLERLLIFYRLFKRSE